MSSGSLSVVHAILLSDGPHRFKRWQRTASDRAAYGQIYEIAPMKQLYSVQMICSIFFSVFFSDADRDASLYCI